MKYDKYDGIEIEKKDIKHAKIGTILLIFIALIVGPLNPFAIVDAGERGVMLRFGEVQDDVHDEGLITFIPVMHKVKIIDVKTKKVEESNVAASKDLQMATTQVAVNYHIVPDTANTLYQEIGYGYESTVISPNIKESVKAATAKFEAVELITRRAEVKSLIETDLTDRLLERGIYVESVSITNFKFSEQFDQAIEAKVTAEQRAKQAENDLTRIYVEAKQRIAEANGEAESIRIIQEQLKVSDDYIEYLKVQQWDGVLPKVTGGAIPLVNIS
ncbi:MAG: prohibitin family protein [Gammaproteobacteria bacterium]|nr:prohibitin family protein [Gammaproteobacteria bacterium]